MISNSRLVLNVVFFLLGNSPASEFFCADVSKHSVCSIFIGVAYGNGIERSETSEHKIQSPVIHPKERIQHIGSSGPNILIVIWLLLSKTDLYFGQFLAP